MFNDLTIVVTNYKTPKILQDSLTYLHDFAEGAKIILVDSDSGDNSVKITKDNFPDVEIIEVKNHSMANAANTGMNAANTKYIMQMNADVFISESSLRDMLNILKKHNVAMVGPRAKDSRGNWQNQGLLYKRYHYYLDIFNKDSIAVDWLHGCCLMLKRENLQYGLFDTGFRFYNEDIEWSYRLRAKGLKCHLVNTELIHLGGSSTPTDIKFIIEGYRGGYLLSKMYKPKWYQTLHRYYVLLEQSYKTTFGNTINKKAAKAITKMFKDKKFDISPFGDNLNSKNNKFIYFD